VVVIVAGFVGAAWGFVADRIAARWPAHEDGSTRAIDWRTPLVAVVGAVAFAATALRFGGDPIAVLAIGIYVVALVLLFATDIDQRLLPDVITLPLIVFAGVVLVAGQSVFIRTSEDVLWAVAAAILVPAGLFLLSIPFGQGAIGQGDLKLLVSVGLLVGAMKLVYALIVGALLAGLTVGALLLLRRISLKSFVPYGPFLIAGILWAILALPQP
jgi:leader peptidase (prepilin peptidase) / N-methyltransferase